MQVLAAIAKVTQAVQRFTTVNVSSLPSGWRGVHYVQIAAALPAWELLREQVQVFTVTLMGAYLGMVVVLTVVEEEWATAVAGSQSPMDQHILGNYWTSVSERI